MSSQSAPAANIEALIAAAEAGNVAAEIVRMCLPHTPRPRNDPWWHYVLVHAALPEVFKLRLEEGVDPNVRCGEGYTILHHLASDYGHPA